MQRLDDEVNFILDITFVKRTVRVGFNISVDVTLTLGEKAIPISFVALVYFFITIYITIIYIYITIYIYKP